jgi:hypothetical protein
MEQKCVCIIGYEHYALDFEHAAVLLQIAAHAVRVERTSFDDPYRPVENGRLFCSTVSIENYDPNPAPPPAAEPMPATPPLETPF